jgi:hypothetical protein
MEFYILLQEREIPFLISMVLIRGIEKNDILFVRSRKERHGIHSRI